MNVQTLKSLTGPVLILAMLTLVALLSRPLTPIDETRYVSVAWEMWLHDEYLVLFKNGEPYSHKPPLLFWLYNLGWMVFGVNEWWPRLVSPLFSFGSLMLTLSIARRLWPAAPAAGNHALWILSASLLWIVFSTSAMFDVMLAFFVLVGMRGLLIAANESLRRGFAWLGFAIGMGVLAKGPVILLHLMPAAVLAPWWLPGMSRHQVKWKPWYGGLLLSVLGGAAMALAWAIPAALHGGEAYRNAIFWGQTANRMVNSFAHKRPFWWYVPLLPLLFFPWLAWPGLWRRFAAAKREGLDSGLRFCLAWAVPVFVSFSLISGKQVHYLVPLFPVFALFAGRILTSSSPGSVFIPAMLTGLMAIAMIHFAVQGLPGKHAHWGHFPVWPGVALLGLSAILAWAGRRMPWRLPAMAGLGAAFLTLLQIYVSGNVGPNYDVHPIAKEIRKLQDRGVPVANEGRYHAQYQFAGRLEKPLAQLNPNEILPWLDRYPNGVVVMYVSRAEDQAKALFRQAYRGEVALLMNAQQVRAFLDGKQKSGGKGIRTEPGADEP